MRPDVLQCVTLCCHGNAYLANEDPSARPVELLTTNSTFRRVHELIFERVGTGFYAQTSGKLADGVGPWLRRLRAESVERLQLCLDRAGFEGGAASGPWGVTCDGNLGLEIWQPTLKSRVLDYDDPSPYKVKFLGERFSRFSLKPVRTCKQALEAVHDALATGSAYCTRGGAPQISLAFDRCMALQAQGNADLREYPDLCPGIYPSENRVLFASALRLMTVLCSGLWIREAFSDDAKPEFAAVTESIWRAMTAAFEAGSAFNEEWEEDIPTVLTEDLQAS
jgi:hypothetical protein